MAISYALAPSPKWYFLDAFGAPAVGGFLTTYSSIDHSTPMFVFSDPTGMFPYLDPIVLDGTGGSPVPMYWELGGPNLYYLVVSDASGNIICTVDNFPIIGGGGSTPVTSNIDIENHIVNGAFLFIDANSSADSVINPVPMDTAIRLAPASGFFSDGSGNYLPTLGASQSGWNFLAKGGAGETSSIRFTDVAIIGTDLPVSPSANATRYFTYSLTAAGAPQTQRVLYQTIPDVETFANEIVTLSFDVNSNIAAVGTIEVFQFYGTGGAPSASTSISTNFSFTPGAWTRQVIPLSVPSIAGKSKGTNGDDCIQVQVNFPLNALGNFNVTNIQLQRGTFGSSPYIYQDYNQDQYKVLIDLMVLGNAIFPTGTLRWVSVADPIGQPLPIPGWIALENIGESLGSTTSGATFSGEQYKNLYVLWWQSFGQAICIVSGGRGATGLDDFNANKQMTICRTIIGSNIAGAGAGITANVLFGSYLPIDFTAGVTPEVPNLYVWLYVKL